MSTNYEGKDKKYIQSKAGDNFPAQELWYNKIDRGFMAFEKKENTLVLTRGHLMDNILDYNTIELTGETMGTDMEVYLEKYLEILGREGYECFAIQM